MKKKLNQLGQVLTKTLNKHFVRGQYFNLKRKYKPDHKKEKKKLKENHSKIEKIFTLLTIKNTGIF